MNIFFTITQKKDQGYKKLEQSARAPLARVWLDFDASMIISQQTKHRNRVM